MSEEIAPKKRQNISIRLAIGLLMVVSFVITPNVSAQESIGGHFIRRWLALGPFIEGELAPKAIEIDYLLSATGMPESHFANLEYAPKAGDSVTLTLEGYATQERIWKVLELPEDGDINRMLVEEGDVDFAVSYLFTFIASKRGTRRELMIGSDDAVKVWLNGKVVLTVAVEEPLTLDEDRVFVDLKKGLNCLMFKVADSRREWGVTVRFADESGLLFFDTPSRQFAPIGKKIIRLPNLKLETKPGTGTEGVWKTYRYVDGLADNDVRAIMQEREGKIWFGTSGGASQFDGKSWKTYTQQNGLANNDVRVILQDKEGVILFGTRDGVSRFDGKSWKTYTQKDGLAHNAVFAIMQDNEGAMWFGTRDGVSRFDGKSWKTYTQKDGLAHNAVFAIMQDNEGAMWFGTRDSVSRFDGKSWKTYTQQDGLANGSRRPSRDPSPSMRGEPDPRAMQRSGGPSPSMGDVSGPKGMRRMHDDVLAIMQDKVAIMQDKEGAIWFGTRDGVSRFDGRNWKTYTQKDGLAITAVNAIIQDKEGAIWFGTWDGVSRFDGKSWKTYTQQNGLANNDVRAIIQDHEGAVWFGTRDGVSQFDGKSWKIYTQKDGLADNAVLGIIQDRKGAMWFGTRGGVSRFDGKNWTTHAENEVVNAIFQDKKSPIWSRTWDDVSRFDGNNWRAYRKRDELVRNWIIAFLEDKEGAMWFGTRGRGVRRFDGKSWKTYTQQDGLAHNAVFAILQDKEGAIWFGTWDGVSRFDGNNWRTYTPKDGLADKRVNAILQDREGGLWFGTDGGISRYDGKSWKTYTQKDGLASNAVTSILQDKEGVIWFGTDNGGISRFDNRCFQTIDSRDGLTSDSVNCLYMDRTGHIWIGTDSGVVRFISNKIPPFVHTQVIADETYTNAEGAIKLNPGVRRISLSYHAISFKTRPGEMKYFYQLVGKDTDWQGPTNKEVVEYSNLKPREYTFRVQAVDRDLNYSKPDSALIFIPPPPFYQTIIFPVVLSIIGGASLFGIIILAIQKIRSSRAEKLRLQQELEDARQMQLSLLPKSAPLVEGFDIAGFSHPAREVGGDFFDYLSLKDGKIGIALADVSGKGLKGAMNAVLASGMIHVLASGMIHELVKIEEVSCGEILSVLNAHLYPRMEKQMFTALGLAILDKDAKALQWANAAQPYPMVKRGEQVFEFKSDGELPLGMMRNVEYQDWELELQAGDIVIFYTDGIIEAENEAEEIYGTERLERVVAQMNSTRSAEEIIKTILRDVTDFVGTAEQYDDMTVVVVKRL